MDTKFKKAVLTGLQTIINIQVPYDHPIKDDFNKIVLDAIAEIDKPKTKPKKQNQK